MTADRDALAAALQRAWLSRRWPAWALWPLACLFGSAVRLRNRLFRSGWLAVQRMPVPVVAVGNLITGGAGKTPAVLAIVDRLRRAGWRPGIVSRGHARSSDALVDVRPGTPVRQCGDEPLLLRLRSGVPVVVHKDRPAAARELLRAHPEVNLIITDDGLQHRRLHRDVQVIVFDERGIGNGWLLPAGPLREPFTAAQPVESLVLYNAPRPSTPWPGHIGRRHLAGVVPLRRWWEGEPPRPDSLEQLLGRPVLAAAGIARPQRFFDLLRSARVDVIELALPDHHAFDTMPWPAGTPEVVVTEKDAVKLSPRRTGSTAVWVAALDFVPDPGFDAALDALLGPPPAKPE